MRNVNHARPQLRLLDNIRRELGRIPSDSSNPQVDKAWPAYLRPVVARKEAHLAFSKLFNVIDAWSGSDGIISFSDFPADLLNAAQAFAEVRVHHDYDDRYSGSNWVADLTKSANVEAQAWGEFLALFVKPHLGQP